MARQPKTAPKLDTAEKTPPAPKPWHDGLSPTAVAELERLGYHDRENVLLFVTMKPRWSGLRDRNMLYSPLHLNCPWLHHGIPQRVSLEVFNEVREWLGAEPIQ